jgi:hypothetical protein
MCFRISIYLACCRESGSMTSSEAWRFRGSRGSGVTTHPKCSKRLQFLPHSRSSFLHRISAGSVSNKNQNLRIREMTWRWMKCHGLICDSRLDRDMTQLPLAIVFRDWYSREKRAVFSSSSLHIITHLWGPCQPCGLSALFFVCRDGSRAHVETPR